MRVGFDGGDCFEEGRWSIGEGTARGYALAILVIVVVLIGGRGGWDEGGEVRKVKRPTRSSVQVESGLWLSMSRLEL